MVLPPYNIKKQIGILLLFFLFSFQGLTPLFSADNNSGTRYSFAYDSQPLFFDSPYLSIQLANKILNAVESAVPRNKRTWRVTLHTHPEEQTEQEMTAQILRSRQEIRITLPVSITSWQNDPQQLHQLTSWMILARLGYPPEQQDKIKNHWIVRAISRKTAGEASRIDMPLSRYSPAAYALTARGILPELKQVIASCNNQLFDSAELVTLADEYAELLYDACSTNGFLPHGFASKILMYTLQYPTTDQLFLFLASASQSGARDIYKKYLSTPGVISLPAYKTEDNLSRQDQYDIMNLWFRDFLQKRLINYFTPAAISYMQEQYQTFSKITYKELIQAYDNLEKQQEILSTPAPAEKNSAVQPGQKNVQQKMPERKVMELSSKGLREEKDPEIKKQVLLPETPAESPVATQKTGIQTAKSSRPDLNALKKNENDLYCHLWELPVHCEDMAICRSILQRKAEELNAMKKICPASLYPGLAKLYNSLMGQPNRNNRTQFSQNIRIAENAFMDDLQKSSQIEASISQAEARLIPVSIRFYQTLQSV